jgi:hypothetical protein
MQSIDIGAKNLFDISEKYYEKSLNYKRFEHKDIIPLIDKLNKQFVVKQIGKSVKGKSINLIKIGNGEKKVFLWSQMHGDEPTATMAFFDFFNFVSSFENKEIIDNILNNLTLYFIPMLNPDGAEKIDRRNAAGIDLNRDYLRLQSPEAKILKDTAFEIMPNFAFNMHDQDFRWSVGNTNNLATLSFLASVSDESKTINNNRANAIKLINLLFNDAEIIIPGCTARYLDDYEPRSFGDNFSNYFPTVLIESGRYKNDINKTFTRKLTFTLMVKAFLYIANNLYLNSPIEPYFDIPSNGKFLYDLILRNVKYKINGTDLVLDICINREEFYAHGERNPYFISSIEEIGDCRYLHGIEEYDCSDLILEIDNLIEKIDLIDNLTNQDILSLLEKGKLFLISNYHKPYFNYPINIVNNNFKNELTLHKPANFILKNGNDIKYIVINGMIIALKELPNLKINGMVIK